jgi:hypothetical protein
LTNLRIDPYPLLPFIAYILWAIFSQGSYCHRGYIVTGAILSQGPY